MSIVSGAKIVEEGLVFYLDTANQKSYPGTGTTWNDLSGNVNNGTLVNGVGFSQDNKGHFIFDGVNDYVSTPISAINTNATYNVWVNRTASINSFNMVMGQYLPYFAMNSSNRIHFSMNISGQKNIYTNINSIENNKWYYLTFVHSFDGTSTTASTYINGELKATQSFTGSQSTSSGRTFMLGGWRSDVPNDLPFYGKISQVSIYSRALNSEEIKQNFEAHRKKYGI